MVLKGKITLNGNMTLDYAELSEPSILWLGERDPQKNHEMDAASGL